MVHCPVYFYGTEKGFSLVPNYNEPTDIHKYKAACGADDSKV